MGRGRNRSISVALVLVEDALSEPPLLSLMQSGADRAMN